MLVQQYKSKDSKYISLFLPGFPGEYRERKLTEDLKNFGYDIFSLIYPGTYNEEGEFSPETIIDSIKKSIQELKVYKKPILIVAYSLSTYFILKSLDDCENIMSIIFFSPIADLKKTIKVRFLQDLNKYNDSNEFKVNIVAFKSLIDKEDDHKNYSLYLERLSNLPLLFAIGEKDDVIDILEMKKLLSDYKRKKGLNSIYELYINDGTHKLDSLYEDSVIYKYIASLVYAYNLRILFTNYCVYLWGALLNYRFSNDKSDIDVIIIKDFFSYEDYLNLNVYTNEFNNKYNLIVDVIVNTFDELKSDERIRSNRGPSFVHELQYYYFPLLNRIENDVLKKESSLIIKDAIFANDLNIYKSKKTLLNYKPDAPASSWIIKNFIIGCYYYQYIIGNLYPDQNFIDKYFSYNSKINTLLNQCIKNKNNIMYGITLEFLKEVLEAHEKLFEKK